MQNVSTATLVGHDEANGVSWITWNDLRLRVPFAGSIDIGSLVTWTLPSDQIRLPARSARPERAGEAAFRARLLDIRGSGAQTEIRLCPSDHPDQFLILTVSSEIVARKGIREGDELLLRLRGDTVGVKPATPQRVRLALAFVGGAAVGALGGLIGLGGAEFRLPVLITVFGFAALSAVILNKPMSLVVVVSALAFRAAACRWTRCWPTDRSSSICWGG